MTDAARPLDPADPADAAAPDELGRREDLGRLPPAGADPVPREVGAPATAASPFDHPPEDFLPEPPADDDDLGPAGDPEAAPPAFDPRPGREPAGPGPRTGPGEAELDALIGRCAAVYASAAADAFQARRYQLQGRHGDKAATDLSRDPYAMIRDLAERAQAVSERLQGRPPIGRERLELARNTLRSVGAIALALHDRLEAAIAAAPEEARP